MESGCKPSNNVKKSRKTSGKKRDRREYEPSSRRAEESCEMHDVQIQLEVVDKVSGWQLEHMELLVAEKMVLEKTLKEERQLFTDMQERWMTLLKSRMANMSSFQQPPMASDPCRVSTVSKLETALEGMRQQLKLRSDDRDKWKAKSEKLEEEEAHEVHMKKRTRTCEDKAEESAGLPSAQAAGNYLEEGWQELEQQNLDFQPSKRAKTWCRTVSNLIVDSHNASKAEVSAKRQEKAIRTHGTNRKSTRLGAVSSLKKKSVDTQQGLLRLE